MSLVLPSDPEGLAAGLRRRAVRGGAILMATRLAMQLALWGVTLIVARILRPYDYGLMTTGSIFVGLADLLAEAGVGKALVQKPRLEPADLSAAFTLSLLLSAAFYGVLLLLSGPAAVFLATPEFGPFLRVLGLLVLLMPFRTVPAALLDRGLYLGRQSAVYLACSVIQSGLVLTLALAGFGYWALAAGALAGRALEGAALVYASGWRPRLAVPRAEARALLGFGIHVSLGSLLWFVYSNSDYAVVGRMVGPVMLGYYALAFQLISLPVQKLTANCNQVSYPVFCRLQGDRARLRDWYLRLTVLLGFLGVPVLTGMALVAEDGFALVLGEKWLPAVLPFRLLSAVGILMIYSHSLPPLLNALGRPDINLKYTAACTLLFPAAFLVGAVYGGVAGVCIAWLVLYPLMAGVTVWLTRNLTGIGLTDLVRAQVPVLGAVAFMIGVVWATQWLLAGPDQVLLRLGLAIAAGVLSYGGFLLLLARHTVLADVRVLLRELRK